MTRTRATARAPTTAPARPDARYRRPVVDEDAGEDGSEAEADVEALWRVVQDVELGLATATKVRDVQVSVFDGGATVRLTGTAPDEAQKAKALMVAARAPGVTRVIDDLVVAAKR